MARLVTNIFHGAGLVVLSVFVASIAVVYHRWSRPWGVVLTVVLFVSLAIAVTFVDVPLWKRAIVSASVFTTVSVSGIPHYGDYMLGQTWEGYVLLGLTFVFSIVVVIATEFRNLGRYHKRAKTSSNRSDT